MTDIVERLRSRAYVPEGWYKLADEAADEITRLRMENAALRRALELLEIKVNQPV